MKPKFIQHQVVSLSADSADGIPVGSSGTILYVYNKNSHNVIEDFKSDDDGEKNGGFIYLVEFQNSITGEFYESTFVDEVFLIGNGKNRV
jgi:hypothetical protein